jgi:hypothetical protein
MPLIRFDLIEGRSQTALDALLNTAHAAMVEAFGVLESDRYQVVHEHPRGHLRLRDTGLGLERSDDVVVLQLVSRPRSTAQKQLFYRLLCQRLGKVCGLAPADLIVTIVINSDADWSFGNGEAQFLTGSLG